MQGHVCHVPWCKRSRHPEDKARSAGEGDRPLASEPIRDGSSEKHGHKHARVVDGADEGTLPFLAA